VCAVVRVRARGKPIYAIEAIEEEVDPGKWVLVAEFDGYTLPSWDGLPERARMALVALNDGKQLRRRERHGEDRVREPRGAATC